MKKAAIVYNPVSGGGQGEAVCRRIAEKLGEKGIPYAAYPGEQVGHMGDCTKRALEEGADLILVIGGDGTVREAAEPLAGTDAVLGLIPCGSGNDLSRTLKIPKDPEKALAIALGGRVRSMDAGRANDAFFLNVAGCGFDVDVLLAEKTVHNISKNGSVAYFIGLLKALLHLNIRKMKAEWLGGTIESGMLITAAGNGGYFGGGMNIAPGADPFDGLLDFCVISDVHWYDVPFLLPRFLTGRHIRSKKVRFFRGTELTVVCEPASMLEVDGEILPGTPVHYKVLPGALKIMTEA